MSTETPEFVIWSLEHQCRLREDLVDESCEKTWRHLRPLHAFSRAEEEQRIFEGICVQESADQINDVNDRYLGFRVDEVLDFYGGQSYVRQQCDDCKANAAARFYNKSLAGCVGILREDATLPGLSDLVTQAVNRLDLQAKVDQFFFKSRNPWYAIWCATSAGTEQLNLVNLIFSEMALGAHNVWNPNHPETQREVEEFCAALKIALQHQIPIRFDLLPKGMVTENSWIVSSHCYQCRASMNEIDKKCENCGRVGCCHPERKRKSRGDRPFWSLSGFLGSNGAADFLRRYRELNQ